MDLTTLRAISPWLWRKDADCIARRGKSLVMCGVAAFLSLSLLGYPVDDIVDEGGCRWSYTRSEGEVTITKVQKIEETACDDLKIPETLNGYPVAVLGDGNNRAVGSGRFKSVTIPKGVRVVRDALPCNLGFGGKSDVAFSWGGNCAVFSEGVTSIGDNAFYRWTSLTNATIPNSMTSIGEDAFMETSISQNTPTYSPVIVDGWVVGVKEDHSLNASIHSMSLVLTNGIRGIADSAFAEGQYWKRRLTRIQTNARYIGSEAFSGCNQLKEVVLTKGVESIGYRAFDYCTALTRVTIPDGVTSIGDGAFRGCSGLTRVTIPDSVTSIGVNAFPDSLKEEIPVSETASLLVVDGWIVGGKGENPGSVVLPEGIRGIAAYAFYDSSRSWLGCLTWQGYFDVTLPTGLKSIGEGAFYGACLMGISIPNSVTTIGANAFAYSGLKEIAIPSSVKSIGERAFEYAWSLRDITIPSSVASIGSGAFASCSSLTNIVLSEGVTTIGASVFERCSSLTHITLPSSVRSIGASAFYCCSGLTGIEIPFGVTSIGDGAFKYASLLTNVTIPNSVTNLGGRVFESCEKLTSATLSEGMASVGTKTFYGCKVLTNVTIPEGITDIGCLAFAECESLTGVTIPSSVTSIGARAFSNCSSLGDMTIPDGVTRLEQGVFDGCSGLKWVSIPSGLTDFGAEAFSGCRGLSGVWIPPSVTNIGENAFCGTRLTDVTIPDGLIRIGDSAFAGTRLTSVTIPVGVTSVGTNAFGRCSYLVEVTIRTDATNLENAFSGCAKVTKVTLEAIPKMKSPSLSSLFPSSSSVIADVTLGASITTIPVNFFGSCKALKTFRVASGSPHFKVVSGMLCTRNGRTLVTYPKGETWTTVSVPEGVTDIGDYAFSECDRVTSVVMPAGVERVGDSAFQNCGYLSRVELPDSVTQIGAYAFSGCYALKFMPFPGNVMSIGAYAFRWCSSWYKGEVLPISKNVAHIGEGAFLGVNADSYCVDAENPLFADYDGLLCTKDGATFVDCPGSLRDLTIPSSVTRIQDYALKGCSSLTNVVIPSSVKAIGRYAFDGCSALTSIAIPFGVTRIQDYALRDCSRLTKVVIPSSVKTIGKYAFDGCSALTSIAIPFGVTDIEEYAFSSCKGLTSLRIPSSVTNIGYYAFEYCKGLTNVWLPKSLEGKLDRSVFSYCGSTLTINYYENVSVDTGDGRAVTIPGDWLEMKTARTATDVAANGRKVWECYLLGLDPERADDDFRIVSFALKDGKPVFTFNHTEDGSGASFVPRIRILGKVRLEETEWAEVPDGGESAFRFFKAEVTRP